MVFFADAKVLEIFRVIGFPKKSPLRRPNPATEVEKKRLDRQNKFDWKTKKTNLTKNPFQEGKVFLQRSAGSAIARKVPKVALRRRTLP